METLIDPIKEYRARTKEIALELLERIEDLKNTNPHDEGIEKQLIRLKYYLEFDILKW
jgi:hypothetical protein